MPHCYVKDVGVGPFHPVHSNSLWQPKYLGKHSQDETGKNGAIQTRPEQINRSCLLRCQETAQPETQYETYIGEPITAGKTN
jgi:hypothetical protein